jgi:hypothetical protein
MPGPEIYLEGLQLKQYTVAQQKFETTHVDHFTLRLPIIPNIRSISGGFELTEP